VSIVIAIEDCDFWHLDPTQVEPSLTAAIIHVH